VCIKFIGLDPIEKPIPIRPVAHYSMGGIECDINGLTRTPGIWVAGEASCVSLHGANRLGSNSTGECLVWGGIAGAEISKALSSGMGPPAALSDARVKAACGRSEEILNREGKENLYALRKELRATMDKNVGVFRKREELATALDTIRSIRDRAKKAPVADKGRAYNSNWFHALELDNLIDLADVLVSGALAREESRGGHARRDFPTRDDDKWLKHTLAWRKEGGPRFDYKPVAITTWKPVERKY
jgi:succinate dehydrogenase / fumarate reductase flavoprotein subunit